VKKSRVFPVAIFTACLLITLLSAPVSAQKKGPASPVQIAKAVIKEISPVMTVSGTVISRDDVDLSAEVEGSITWMAEVGQYIELGEAIATIDDTRLKLQKREAVSKVQAAQTRIGYLGKESRRLKQMAKKQHTSQTVLEQTISEYDISVAELDAAQAQLALIEDKLEKTNIRAPFNGYVTERHKMPGEHVKIADEVVHLVGLENIEIEASAPLMYVRFVTKGTELMIKSRETEAMATVTSLVSIGTGQSRQFIMRLAINQKNLQQGQQGWIPGTAVRVMVPTEEKKTRTVVPRDALVIRRDGIYVFRVKEDNTVERIQVTTGAAVDDEIAIIGEIKDGDSIVIRGNERLRPGQSVKGNDKQS
jgi:RND family efflux transporter MFP subunit